MTEPIDPRLLEDVSSRAGKFLASLWDRPVAPAPKAIARLRASLGGSLPSVGASPSAVLAELDALGSPATVASAGPRYFGFVHGGALPAPLAANMLAAAWDQNAFGAVSSPAAAAYEEAAVRWIVELLGLPAETEAGLTTGATMASFACLAAARRRVLAQVGWDVERSGLFGAPPIAVAVSAEIHPTVRKALGLLGLGRDRVVELRTDSQGRIRADALPALAGPAIVCAQAGNVQSGAFDPFGPLRHWADQAGAWLHVDGAFGLWALASPRLAPLATSVVRADSWSTDAHKWLNVPYDSGIALVRHPGALRSALAFDAPYLPADAPREPFHTTPESSRRARGVDIWAALRQLGRNGVAEMVERHCRQARRLADALVEAGLEVLNDVCLNQVVVSFGDDDTNAAVIDGIQRAGICWAGPTIWQGRTGMRLSVSCWATRDEDIERSIASIVAAVRAVRERGSRG